MNKERLQQLEKEHSSKDTVRIRRWSEKRINRFDTLNAGVDAALVCRIGFPALICCLAIALAAELRAYFLYQQLMHGIGFFYRNLSVSWLICFACFTPFLLGAAVLQLRRGFDNKYFDKFRLRRSGRAANLPRRFRFVAWFAGCGLAASICFYLIARSLAV